MRSIGYITDETHARRFSDYLYSNAIENSVEIAGDNGWEVWISDEEEINRSELLLEGFTDNPDDPKFADALQLAERKRREEQKDKKAFQRRYHDGHRTFAGSAFRLAPATMSMIAISVLVAIISTFGRNESILQPLFITEYTVEGGFIRFARSLPEIFDGQLWRLITPIFIHFGSMHILFNMIWLIDLGSMIERAQGCRFFLLFVLVSAALSNIAQFMRSGPSFGGMSGVVYALLSYAWIRGKLDLASGLFIHKHTMAMMTVWFFLCLAGVIGHVANTVHAVGLGVGLLWGYVSAHIVNSRR